MTATVYMFEAHSIQQFVLRGDTLRDLTCCSELIESLISVEPEQLRDSGDAQPRELSMVLAECNLVPNENCWFARRGGAAFYLFIDGDDASAMQRAEQLRDLWAMVVSAVAPDLPFVHTVQQSDSPAAAIKHGGDALRLRRNTPVADPVSAGPFVRRVARTGRPASHWRKVEKELVDRSAANARLDRYREGRLLLARFTPSGVADDALSWPTDMEPQKETAGHNTNSGKKGPPSVIFPFNGDNRWIAVVHADGNGLGQILMDIIKGSRDTFDTAKTYAGYFLSLSKAIASATESAVRCAVEQVIVPVSEKHNNVMPLRPIILGGDDLTVVVRADLAIEFVRVFAEAFEQETTKELAALKHTPDAIKPLLANGLTTCAGVAFIKANQPFTLGYALVESMCERVKLQARLSRDSPTKPIPSALAFHRLTSTLIEDYPAAVARESTLRGRAYGNDADQYQLTMGAYGVGEQASALPQLQDLLALVKAFTASEASHGPLRQLATTLHDSLSDADTAYQRWKKVLADRDKALCSVFETQHAKIVSAVAASPQNPNSDAAFFALLPDSRTSQHEDARYCSYLADLNHAIAVNSQTGGQL